jgi:hypothetical protein
MRIWVNLQVLEIWDFGSTLKSRQAKLSQAKPTQQHGMPARESKVIWPREDVGSVYFWKEARMDSFAAALLTPEERKQFILNWGGINLDQGDTNFFGRNDKSKKWMGLKII